MKISIVTISFNQRKYLEETIRSVINQNYSELEYIIVDAGSTDGSRDIIMKYKNYFEKIIFETDDGPADGLNKGFSSATGDIFGFINSDDLLLPNALNTVAEEYFKNPEADIFYGNGYFIDSKGKILRKIYSDKFDIKRYAYGCVTIIQPSLFFKKEAFYQVNKFNKNNNTCWDGELLANFGKKKLKFKHINQFLSSFRFHEEGNSGMGDKNPKYKIWIKDRDRIFEYIIGRKKNMFDIFLKLIYKFEKLKNNKKNIKENLKFKLIILWKKLQFGGPQGIQR
jgi:glycosyltransferase involved in cell wall biosynthesis